MVSMIVIALYDMFWRIKYPYILAFGSTNPKDGCVIEVSAWK